MGKVIEKIVNSFNGGISNDKRVTNANKFAITKHFDVFTYPHKLVPNYATIDAKGTYSSADFKAFKIVKFVYAPRGSEYRLFAYGVANGSTDKPAVYMFDIDAGDFLLSQSTNAESTVAGRNEEVFFEYKGFIYMWSGSRYLVRFDTAGAIAFNNNYYDATSFTTVADPVHHQADDIAYFFHDNFVSKLDNTTWSAKVLTLPSNMKITAACEFGNYLAIACVTKGSSNVNSVVFLWDRDSSLATLTDRINFGRGSIVHLANLDNKLTAVMDYYLNVGQQFLALKRGKVIIKQANGNFAVSISELLTDTNTISGPAALPRIRTIKDNKLYFVTTAEVDGDPRGGIWVVDSNGSMTIDFYEPLAIVNAGLSNETISYQGIYATGNMWWIAHSGDGSVNRIDVNPTYSYTYPAIYESLLLNEGDSDSTKKVIGVSAMFEPLPANAIVKLYYRKDEEIKNVVPTWTLIYTYTSTGSLSHSAINIESSGATLPQFKEIQYRVESLGGSVITGIKYKHEVIDKQLF